MAYDEGLAARVREILAARADVAEKKMFGGLTFMVGGHMCCGIAGEELMLRLGETGAADALGESPGALGEPHVRPMDFTGRPLKGMVFVAPDGCADDSALKRWVSKALDFVFTLPPKD